MEKEKHDEMPDPEKIKEILEVVSDKVPSLLRQLSDVLYGVDQAKKFGKAAAVFYKELKGTGMSDSEIFELTRQYMGTLNLDDDDEEVGKHVGRKIREAFKE
jgi:hypothetical protein